MLAPLSTADDRRQAQLLLRISQQAANDETANTFLRAAETGDFAAVNAYLENGGDVNVLDEDGGNALFSAAHGGHLEVLKAIVAHGADVNHLNKYGAFPLSYADCRGQQAVVEFLQPLTSPKLLVRWERDLERAKKMAARLG